MCAIGINAQALAPTVLGLIDQINTDYTTGFNVFGTDPVIGGQLQDHISMLEDNLLSALIHILNDYGCCLVIANETAFIIPEAPPKPVSWPILHIRKSIIIFI